MAGHSDSIRASIAARGPADAVPGAVDHDARPAPGESVADFIIRTGELLDWSRTLVNVRGTYSTPATHCARLLLLDRLDDYIQRRPPAPSTRKLLALLERVQLLSQRDGADVLVPLLFLLVHRPAEVPGLDAWYARRMVQAEVDLRASLRRHDKYLPEITVENFTRTANLVLRRLQVRDITRAGKPLD